MTDNSTVLQELFAAYIVQLGGNVVVRGEHLAEIAGMAVEVDYDIQLDKYYVKVVENNE